MIEDARVAGGGLGILVAEHVFPGHLSEFVVELTSVDSSVGPSGLRLLG